MVPMLEVLVMDEDEAVEKDVVPKEEAKEITQASLSQKAKTLERKESPKARWILLNASCVWSMDIGPECPNRMVQQVVNSAQQPNQEEYGQAQQTVYVAAGGQSGQAGSQQQRARGSPADSYPPSSTTASTVRRIYTIPFGIPSLSSSSSSSVRMMLRPGESQEGDGRKKIFLSSNDQRW